MLGEHDGDCLCSLSGGLNLSRSRRNDHVEYRSVRLQSRQLIGTLCPAELNDDVSALDITKVAQPYLKCFHLICPSRSGARLRNPIRATFSSCARTLGDHAATIAPISVMNSRRRMCPSKITPVQRTN
jgi:hypothetical protein